MECHSFDLAPKYGGGGPIRVVVRAFQPKDHDQVLQVFCDGMLRTIEETHEHFPVWKAWAEEGSTIDLPDISTVYIKPGGNFWVAVRETGDGEEEIVGIVGLERSTVNKHEATLRRMSVKSDYRRYGVGRLIVQELEEWAVKNGISIVNLTTNALVSNFYASLGYQRTHNSVHCTDPYFEIIHYVKRLGE